MELSAMMPKVMVVMPMVLAMNGAMVPGGAGIGRKINEYRGQQGEQDKFIHNVGFETNQLNSYQNRKVCKGSFSYIRLLIHTILPGSLY
jgi:hypothetical protein